MPKGKNNRWLMAVVLVLATFAPAIAQDEDEDEEDARRRFPDREELFRELEDSDLFDFAPARSLFPPSEEDEATLEEESGDDGTPAPSRSRRPSTKAKTIATEDASRKIDADDAEMVKANFDGMSLVEFLQLMSEIRDDLNFIIHPDVGAGSVTIKSSKQIMKADIPDLIQSVLEVNGFAAVPSGRYFKIVPLDQSPSYNVETLKGKRAEDVPDDDRLITQIIPLDYIQAREMSEVLSGFVAGSGHTIVSHEGTNTIIISSSASSIRRMMLVVEDLDVPSNASEDALYVYYLENADAEKVAQILNDLYIDKDQSSAAARRRTNARSTEANRRSRRGSRPAGGDDAVASVSGTTSGGNIDAMFVPYPDINALIIKASPRSYTDIQHTIGLLDVSPKQVFIEMLIAEITLDEDMEFGIEWAMSASSSASIGGTSHTYQHDFSRGSAQRDSASSIFDGFRYMVSETNRLQMLLDAKAGESKLNVLASPHILASDNKKAEISITNEVPVSQSTFSETGVERLSYQYIDAGIKLSVTPHINEHGMVTLELEQEVSEISGFTGTGQPTIVKRNANTTVVVLDRQTLAIGGLIEESTVVAQTGIPILSKIPLLGYLFRSTSTRTTDTELVILITPHVISSLAEGNTVTQGVRGRLDGLRGPVDDALDELDIDEAARQYKIDVEGAEDISEAESSEGAEDDEGA